MRWIKLFIVTALISLVSCKKKEVDICPPSDEPLAGSWLVLNEGLFQQNNGSITKINSTSGVSTSSFFSTQAGRPLGDTGNDIKRYGDKIYVVVNESSTLEVLDARTGEFVKQIIMVNGSQPKKPRFIDFSSGKAFISCFDGYVDVLDTITLNITNRVQVGSNPDHLRVVGDKIYVSNSGGLNFPNVDSTLSVIDISTETELSKIVIGKNPGSIALGGNGDIYAVSRGDFGGIPSRMHRISTLTDTKTESYSFDASQLIEMNGNISVFEIVGSESIKLFDVGSNQLGQSTSFDLTGVETPYKVQFDATIQKYFIFDANGYVNQGFIHAFSASGVFQSKTKTGLVPAAMLSF